MINTDQKYVKSNPLIVPPSLSVHRSQLHFLARYLSVCMNIQAHGIGQRKMRCYDMSFCSLCCEIQSLNMDPPKPKHFNKQEVKTTTV